MEIIFIFSYCLMTLALNNIQRAIYLKQKEEIQIYGFASNPVKTIRVLKATDVIKYLILVLIGIKYSATLAIVAFVLGFVVPIIFTLITKDNYAYLKSKMNALAACLTAFTFCISSSLFIFPKIENSLLSNGLKAELILGVTGVCDKNYPIGIIVQNNTYLTLKEVDLVIAANRFGRTANLIRNGQETKLFDHIIEPFGNGILCYKAPRTYNSSFQELYWSVEINKPTANFTRDNILEKQQEQVHRILPEGFTLIPAT